MEIFGAWVIKRFKRTDAAPNLSQIRSGACHRYSLCPFATRHQDYIPSLSSRRQTGAAVGSGPPTRHVKNARTRRREPLPWKSPEGRGVPSFLPRSQPPFCCFNPVLKKPPAPPQK